MSFTPMSTVGPSCCCRDPAKRTLPATADFMDVFGVLLITISEDEKNSVTLLFDPDRSLEERVIAEQFAI